MFCLECACNCLLECHCRWPRRTGGLFSQLQICNKSIEIILALQSCASFLNAAHVAERARVIVRASHVAGVCAVLGELRETEALQSCASFLNAARVAVRARVIVRASHVAGVCAVLGGLS